MSKKAVQDKRPAPTQITAEQILREAKDRQEKRFTAPKQKITDPEELKEFRVRQRKQFEDTIRHHKFDFKNWVRYGRFEANQEDWDRMRSVFERALGVEHTDPSIWIAYAEEEIKGRHINRARNVWDRAVALLPRIEALWFKYIHMEETLGNFAGVRQIFDRWMKWNPDPKCWHAYINFEVRYEELDLARAVFEKFVQAHPNVDSWMKYAKFEEKQRQTGRAREVFERAVKDQTGVAENIEKLYVAFAEFEERAKEFDRARAIYRFALDNIPKQFAKDLFQKFTAFEKKHGDKGGIEDVILRKRRFQYETELKANSVNYDTWFDYVRLEENNGSIDSTREVYKRAIAQVPPMTEKRLWRRYIYLWVNYALFEELQAQDLQQAREVYQACIKLIPHKSFSFSKIWILYAHFEVRQMDLDSARKILGRAIGMAPKDKIFRAYIQLELELGNIDRCRTLHQKRLQWAPSNCEAWLEFAELEVSVREIERARAIFELAVGQPVLDMPEKLWKGYIDFEIAQGENDRVRALYTRLLELTHHVKVWMSYAQFETSVPDLVKARDIYSKADASMKGKDTRKDERVALLEAWKEFEDVHGSEEEVKAVAERLPKKIKKRRDIKTEDGLVVGSEEYYDYIFPDVSDAAPALKLLQMAHKWKQSKMQGGDS